MNKKELITTLSEATSMTKKDTEYFLNAFVDVVTDTLSKGDSIMLVGFGSFTTKERKPRTGRNPRNPKEIIDIPESVVPVFKAGKDLKTSVKTAFAPKKPAEVAKGKKSKK